MWITSVVDEVDHAITDDDMTAGLTAKAGTYRAMCGAEVLPAPLSDAPCGRCFACVATIRASHAQLQRERQAAQPRKHCRLTRVFGRHR